MATQTVTQKQEIETRRIAEQIMSLNSNAQEQAMTFIALLAKKDARVLEICAREDAGELTPQEAVSGQHALCREVMVSGKNPLDAVARETLKAS